MRASLHGANRYQFSSVWTLPVKAGDVFDVVTDPGTYPLWWPDIHGVGRIDDDTAEVVCRSVLPYELTFRLHRAEQDLAQGRMLVGMTGDLEGFCRSTVVARPRGVTLQITQEVVVNKRLLRMLAPVARPVFRANHWAMMRRGQQGLRRFLS
ncbi:polyketide cyclase [Kibdelosporangium philippinense]|uniref:Polyketide cyclase n=1 Tax=Kibdelosporangium philippinense TaxID=211113 RepID=A0ABS8Z229_9PSEU|nr:SRPBCC family protein [Kibdelosporangium philippinense]MCE7001830.1 polyketide cyclase [Kibdelosporangium philippinense]